MGGGVQSPLTIDAAAGNMFMSTFTWVMVLAAIVLILPKSPRRLAVLATLLQPAVATWTDTHAVVHSALSAYSDYVLIMVPVTLALAGVELAEFSCSTTRLVQAAANAMTGSLRRIVVHEHGQEDAKWAILLANRVTNMAVSIALEAAHRANQWSQYAADSREPAWKQAHMATMDAVNAATLAMATALTCGVAAETVAYRGTLTIGQYQFAAAPASSPAQHEDVELPLHERFAVLVSEAYSAHAHEVRAVLCSYLRYRRTQAKEQARPLPLCTVTFRCPQYPPGQTILNEDPEYSIDEDVNSDGLNRHQALDTHDDNRAQHARNIIAEQARTVRHLRMRLKELMQDTPLRIDAVPLAPSIEQRLTQPKEGLPPRPSTAWMQCHNCHRTMAFGGACPCHEAMYCNENCQHSSWPSHKTTCAYLAMQHATHQVLMYQPQNAFGELPSRTAHQALQELHQEGGGGANTPSGQGIIDGDAYSDCSWNEPVTPISSVDEDANSDVSSVPSYNYVCRREDERRILATDREGNCVNATTAVKTSNETVIHFRNENERMRFLNMEHQLGRPVHSTPLTRNSPR